MSSAFRPVADCDATAKKYKARRGISFALQVAALAGLITWAVVQLSARAIEKKQQEIFFTQQQSLLKPKLESLANDIAKPLGTGQKLRVQETIKMRFTNVGVTLIDASDQLWQAGTVSNSVMPKLASNEYQMQVVVNGSHLALGTLVLRGQYPVAEWLGIISELSILFAALVSGLCFAYIRFAMRGFDGIHRLLDRMRRGDYCERTAQVGCSQVRSIIEHFHVALGEMTSANDRAKQIYLETAIALSKTIEAKDRYTSGHSQRVAKYAVEMGERLGFDSDRMETLRIGALLHDIGKVAVPDEVLLKKGALNDEEFATMKRHPLAGDRILDALPGMRDMADIARSHHERWDGRGYPMGMAGDSIPLEGRIVAIADAYDALITKRSYKAAMPIERALNIIQKDSGTHFDPYLAQMFVALKRNGHGYRACKPKSIDPSPVRNETMGRR
ncbi:MAG: HD-GYP domain-containing protein [Planctomycetes bacterium]|nr:HD-GYP domain-containing protein [Planctomycetota bacterium]